MKILPPWPDHGLAAEKKSHEKITPQKKIDRLPGAAT
jgi:hypothetical protein